MPGLHFQVSGSRTHPFADGLLITLVGQADDKVGPESQRLQGVARDRNGDGELLRVEIDVPLPRADSAAAVWEFDNLGLEP